MIVGRLFVLFLAVATARQSGCKWAQSTDTLYVTFPLTRSAGLKCTGETAHIAESTDSTQQLVFSSKCGDETWELAIQLAGKVDGSSLKIAAARGRLETVVTIQKAPADRFVEHARLCFREVVP
jgi:hypothetical protein